MTETLITITILFALASAYSYALARERQNLITAQELQIKELKEQLVLWQNKLLPSPLGFETRDRVKRDKTDTSNSPVPTVVTRRTLVKRRADNPEFLPKYNTVAEKAKKIMEKTNTDTSETFTKPE